MLAQFLASTVPSADKFSFGSTRLSFSHQGPLLERQKKQKKNVSPNITGSYAEGNFEIHIKTEQKYKQVTTHKDIKEDHEIFIQTVRIMKMTESREHHRLLAAILIPNLRLVQGRFSRVVLFRQRREESVEQNGAQENV